MRANDNHFAGGYRNRKHAWRSAGHQFLPGDIMVLKDGRQGVLVHAFHSAERHPTRDWIRWLLIEGAGATPEEVDAAWDLCFGKRRKGRNNPGGADRLAVHPEDVAEVIPRVLQPSDGLAPLPKNTS